MTGTSRALKRLGVAGLGAVVAYAGFVPLALSANAGAAASGPFTATNATSVSLSAGDTAALGTCNPFTVTIPAGDSVSVNIQQTAPGQATPSGSTTIGFCNPTTAAEGNTTAANTVNGPGPNGATEPATTAPAPGVTACSQPITTSSTTATCNTTYTDNDAPATNDGKITFGVWSNTAGTMSVNAFGDTNAPPNGAQDASPAEAGATSAKTWVANTASTSDKITCKPTTATNPTSTRHTFTCQVTDANGIALSGQDVNFNISTGPDAGVSYTNVTTGGAQSTNSTQMPAFVSNATCNTTDTGVGGTTAGQATCFYDNNSQPGTDNINPWLEVNQVRNNQTGADVTANSLSKTWVQAAAIGSQVTVTCSPNQTKATGTAPNQGSICQDPTSDTSVTYTATVVNGTPPAGQSGVLVQWAVTNNTGATAGSTVSLSSPTCLTDASGKCSVTLTNSAPADGQSVTVEAMVGTQGAGPTTAFSTKNWHNPTPGEARLVTVSPTPSTQPSGGVQTLTATVTDRFNNPVKNVDLDWSETGPGAFRGGANTAFCTTDATGKCSVDVASLSTESGDETITVTIDPFNYQGPPFGPNATADGNPTAATPTAECNAPASNSFFNGGTAAGTNSTFGNPPATTGGGTPGAYAPTGTTPSAGGGNNTATGATAGACSATAKVTWQTGSNNGSVQIAQPTNSNAAACSSFTLNGTAPSGATVTLTGFNFRQGTFTIGTATAASNGAWTFTGSGICFNTTVTASTGSGSGATNSNTVTLGFHQVFTNVHFTRVGPYRKGLIEYNVSGSSTSIIGGEPVRVQNGACRSALCGITHMRSSGFDRLHIYLLPGTYTFVLYGTGGSDPAFGGDGHQYTNPERESFRVTIH